MLKLKRVMAAVVLAVVILGIAAVKAGAGQEAPELGVDVTYAERYIWRGIPFNEEAVLQPSIDLAQGGFNLNVWGNMDLTDYGDSKKPLRGYGDESGDFTEIDYTAGYETSLGPASVGLGFVTYTFPNHTEWGTGLSTTEVFCSLGLDVPLSPSITAYVDIDDQATEGAGYSSLDLGHSFELADSVSLDVSGHLGHANHKFLKFYYGINEESDFHDWGASVALSISLPGGFYLSPAYSYSALMEEESVDVVEGDTIRKPASPAPLAEWGRDPTAGIFMVSLGWSGGI